MRAERLSRVRICLKALEDPLPPLADVRVPIVDALRLDPPVEPPPGPADPAAHHPVERVEIDNPLEHHRAPHLAGTVYRERSFEELRVSSDDLGIGVIGQLQDSPDGSPYLLRLDRPHHIERRLVAPVAERAP